MSEHDGETSPQQTPSTQRVLDVSGRMCPMPIVALNRAMKRMRAGEEVTVVSDDHLFPEDVSAWCEQGGHTVVAVEAASGRHTVRVRKGGGGDQSDGS